MSVEFNPASSSSTDWKWERVLGCGTFGVVYLVSCRQQFVVKRAPASTSASLRNEKTVFDALRGCPEILACYSAHETERDQINPEPTYNLLLEYAPSGTLRDRIDLNRGPIPQRMLRDFTRMILKGLKHVHCDIKPENILVFPSTESYKYKLKLADFGLAIGPGIRWEKPATGQWRGTLLYLSPESVLEGRIGPAGDIWSFGCTVLHMMTLHNPWAAMLPEVFTNEEFFALIGQQTPGIPLDVSASGKDFLEKCLRRDPTERWTAQMLLNHPFVRLSGYFL